jgi:hypothetical protein
MNTFKNYLIAILTGLLVLTITAQPSTGASDSTKLIEYDRCLDFKASKYSFELYEQVVKACKTYK